MSWYLAINSFEKLWAGDIEINPNSIVVIQYADSNDNHVFERIYVCLEACKTGFAKTCTPLIGRHQALHH